jgi:hypothetical protein
LPCADLPAKTEQPIHIRGDRLREAFVGDPFRHHARLDDARLVDEDIDPAKRLPGLFDGGGDLGRDRHITADREGLYPKAFHLCCDGGKFVCAPRSQDRVGSSSGQDFGEPRTQSV